MCCTPLTDKAIRTLSDKRGWKDNEFPVRTSPKMDFSSDIAIANHL